MNRNFIIAIVVIVAPVSWLFNTAEAGGNNNITNNYFTTETVSTTNTITSGLSDKDLNEALAGAAVAGSHQFDYSTQDYQASITAGFLDSQDAVSFAVGKRWEKVDALFHGSYTRVLDNDHLWVIGGTFRF
jgi:hypothetical protein